MMRRVPVRWRLTAWYAVVFSVALAMLAGGLYLGLRERLYDTLDAQVTAQVELVRSAIRVDDGVPALDGDLTLLNDDALVLLRQPRGDMLDETGDDADELPLGSEVRRDALRGDATTESVEVDGTALRMRTVAIFQDREPVGVLQVALPAEDVQETLDDFVSLLAIGAPMVLGVAALGGYFLAGRALAPVVTISGLASRVSERDLSARLDLDLPNDELGTLVATFNGMLARIEDAFARQRRFTGDAAHELRTPLALMRSRVDLALARPRSPEDYREALEELDADLARMGALVGTLLTLARVDDHRLTIEEAPFDLAVTLRLVLDQYAPLAATHGVSLVDETSPVRVLADEGQIIQLLVNLLDNAIAHTPVGGRIAIGCDASEGRPRLWVADTGPGIAPEHRQRVFDRFYRIDTGRTRASGGVGLGLAIARAIVEAHGGTIEVADRTGPGATLAVTLPADRLRDPLAPPDTARSNRDGSS